MELKPSFKIQISLVVPYYTHHLLTSQIPTSSISETSTHRPPTVIKMLMQYIMLNGLMDRKPTQMATCTTEEFSKKTKTLIRP